MNEEQDENFQSFHCKSEINLDYLTFCVHFATKVSLCMCVWDVHGWLYSIRFFANKNKGRLGLILFGMRASSSIYMCCARVINTLWVQTNWVHEMEIDRCRHCAFLSCNLRLTKVIAIHKNDAHFFRIYLHENWSNSHAITIKLRFIKFNLIITAVQWIGTVWKCENNIQAHIIHVYFRLTPCKWHIEEQSNVKHIFIAILFVHHNDTTMNRKKKQIYNIILNKIDWN